MELSQEAVQYIIFIQQTYYLGGINGLSFLSINIEVMIEKVILLEVLYYLTNLPKYIEVMCMVVRTMLSDKSKYVHLLPQTMLTQLPQTTKQLLVYHEGYLVSLFTHSSGMYKAATS